MTQEIVIRRLLLIKHLFKLGQQQAALPESISFSAVLTMHDAIDMFMGLAAEKKSLAKKLHEKIYLIQYFDLIPELTLRASVDKINTRRNNLKHGGMIPAEIEVVETCAVAKIFFEENTPAVFGVDFSEVSLIDLVEEGLVRNFLKGAEHCLESSQLEQASVQIAKAYFHRMLIWEEKAKIQDDNPWYHLEVSLLIKDGKFYTKAFEPVLEGQEKIFLEPKIKDGYVEVSEGVAALSHSYNQAFNYIFKSLRIWSLGLDFRKYQLYTKCMLKVVSLNNENSEYQIGRPYGFNKTLSAENVRFSIDFVLDFALKIQEFKY